MASVNKVTLIGNLGKDPEIRYFEGGGAVANFPMATTETYWDRTKEERISLPTDWHNISVRRLGLVKIVESYVKKGQQIYIEGKLKTRTYEKDGSTRYITEVVVEEIILLGKKEGSTFNKDATSNFATPVAPSATTPTQSIAKPSVDSPSLSSGTTEVDDLPF